MTDQGRSALAEKLHRSLVHTGANTLNVGVHASIHEGQAESILGTTGLFIADVTKHEPTPFLGGPIECHCGYVVADPTESFYAHIGGPE